MRLVGSLRHILFAAFLVGVGRVGPLRAFPSGGATLAPSDASTVAATASETPLQIFNKSTKSEENIGDAPAELSTVPVALSIDNADADDAAVDEAPSVAPPFATRHILGKGAEGADAVASSSPLLSDASISAAAGGRSLNASNASTAADASDCLPKVDLVFLLDTSGSIEQIYQEHVRWAVALVDALPIEEDTVRVAAVQYAGFPLTEFALGTYPNAGDIRQHLAQINFQSGVTRTGYALRKAEAELFRADRGAREDARKVVVLFTDGLSIDDPLKPAQQLRDLKRVNIYVVSVSTDGFQPEMNRIAGGSANVFGPDELPRLRNALIAEAQRAHACIRVGNQQSAAFQQRQQQQQNERKTTDASNGAATIIATAAVTVSGSTLEVDQPTVDPPSAAPPSDRVAIIDEAGNNQLNGSGTEPDAIPPSTAIVEDSTSDTGRGSDSESEPPIASSTFGVESSGIAAETSITLVPVSGLESSATDSTLADAVTAFALTASTLPESTVEVENVDAEDELLDATGDETVMMPALLPELDDEIALMDALNETASGRLASLAAEAAAATDAQEEEKEAVGSGEEPQPETAPVQAESKRQRGNGDEGERLETNDVFDMAAADGLLASQLSDITATTTLFSAAERRRPPVGAVALVAPISAGSIVAAAAALPTPTAAARARTDVTVAPPLRNAVINALSSSSVFGGRRVGIQRVVNNVFAALPTVGPQLQIGGAGRPRHHSFNVNVASNGGIGRALPIGVSGPLPSGSAKPSSITPLRLPAQSSGFITGPTASKLTATELNRQAVLAAAERLRTASTSIGPTPTSLTTRRRASLSSSSTTPTTTTTKRAPTPTGFQRRLAFTTLSTSIATTTTVAAAPKHRFGGERTSTTAAATSRSQASRPSASRLFAAPSIQSALPIVVSASKPLSNVVADCAADWLFVVDSSGSVRHVYERLKTFLLELLEEIPLEADGGAHNVALLQFAGNGVQRMEWNYDSFRDRASLIQAFSRVRHFTGTTYVGAALESALRILEHRPRRGAAPSVVVLLSDGFTQDDASASAAEIRRQPNTEFVALSIAELSNSSLLTQLVGGNPDNVYIGEERAAALRRLLVDRARCRGSTATSKG